MFGRPSPTSLLNLGIHQHLQIFPAAPTVTVFPTRHHASCSVDAAGIVSSPLVLLSAQRSESTRVGILVIVCVGLEHWSIVVRLAMGYTRQCLSVCSGIIYARSRRGCMEDIRMTVDNTPNRSKTDKEILIFIGYQSIWLDLLRISASRHLPCMLDSIDAVYTLIFRVYLNHSTVRLYYLIRIISIISPCPRLCYHDHDYSSPPVSNTSTIPTPIVSAHTTPRPPPPQTCPSQR